MHGINGLQIVGLAIAFIASSFIAVGMAQGQPYKVSTGLYNIMRYASRFGAYASELYTKLNSLPFANVVLKSTDYTVVAADNGKTFFATGAANFTLPVASASVGPYHFANIADNTMAILAPSSNDTIITDGDAGADSVTFSTSSHKIGSFSSLYALDTDGAGAYKWFALNAGGTTRTIA